MSPSRAAGKQTASEVSTTAEAITRAAKVLTGAAGRLTDTSGSASESVEALQTVLSAIQELAGHLPQLESLAADAKKKADKAFHELDADLRDAVGSRGWRCEGPWPTLYIERAIPIQIDPKTQSVTVGTERVRSAAVERIVEALEPQVQGLLPKKFAPEAFIRDLAHAYDDVVRNSPLVPIFEVYRSFVVRAQGAKFWRDPNPGGFVTVSVDQFRARLTAALERGVIESGDRRELRLLPPIDPKEGLLLYVPAEQRFSLVGRIEFQRGR